MSSSSLSGGGGAFDRVPRPRRLRRCEMRSGSSSASSAASASSSAAPPGGADTTAAAGCGAARGEAVDAAPVSYTHLRAHETLMNL
eukprot:5491118-Prymnesium_polylepis.1